MIVDQPEANQHTENNQSNKENFLERLVWNENENGKWYLGKRICENVNPPSEQDPEIILFDMGGFEADEAEKNKINEGNHVISELGKAKVEKIEEGQAHIKLQDDSEPIPVPVESLTNFIKVNILILGKTKNHLIENYTIYLNDSVYKIKELIAEEFNVPENCINIFLKDKKLESQYIYEAEISNGDTLLVGFIMEEHVYKRSTSRDYSWYDQKNLIPFTVDKPIQVSGFGFFKHTDSTLSKYDLFLYEVSETNGKTLVLTLNDVKVLPSECDSDMYVKKVSFPPIILKANTKYYAYVYYKINDQRTYHVYSGNSDQTVGGVRFKILEVNEEGHKSDSVRGHLPYIIFTNYSPILD